MPAPNAYATSRAPACARFCFAATSVTIDPRIGPAHGVQTSPSDVPSRKPLQSFGCIVLVCGCARFTKGSSLANTIVCNRGNSITSPNDPMTNVAITRKTFGESGEYVPRIAKIMANSENDRTNPRTMNSGRAECERAVDVPRMMGKRGRMHGPAIVTTPASSAKRKRSMKKVWHARFPWPRSVDYARICP